MKPRRTAIAAASRRLAAPSLPMPSIASWQSILRDTLVGQWSMDEDTIAQRQALAASAGLTDERPGDFGGPSHLFDMTHAPLD